MQSCRRFAFLAMLPLFVLYQGRHGIAAPQALLIPLCSRAFAYLGGLPGAGLLTVRSVRGGHVTRRWFAGMWLRSTRAGSR